MTKRVDVENWREARTEASIRAWASYFRNEAGYRPAQANTLSQGDKPGSHYPQVNDLITFHFIRLLRKVTK